VAQRKRDSAQPGKKILAIRFARLGDVILLLPALGSLKDKFPGSELTLLTGHRCAPIAELCPAIDHIIAVDRIAMRDGPVWRALWQMAALVRNVRNAQYDLVVDFHSFRETNLLTWLSRASTRMGMKRDKAPYFSFCFNHPPVIEDKSLHVADMFQKVVASIPHPGWEQGVASGERTKGGGNRPLGRVLAERAKVPTIALYVDAPVPERIWPASRFAEVADFVMEKLGAVVIVISSKERPEVARTVQKASRNPDKLSVFTDLTLPQLVDVIASAHLLVSNDTGPMHIGPAIGVRTLGLFSVGYPEHFRPIGVGDRFLRGNPIERIEVKNVLEAVEEMWVTADRDLRR
jgi:ADP-heptose:LPS heptosyltransferase